MNILIAVTGSVAAIKVSEIVEKVLAQGKSSIKLAVTDASKQFLQLNNLQLGDNTCEVYDDEMENTTWSKKGDAIYHVELSQWADVLLVLPLTAHTLAKVAHGMCDNLVTAIIRCWPFDGSTNKIAKPIMAFPCMNTAMWNHPLTSNQLATLEIWGWTIHQPIIKQLACGQFGKGALMEVDDVVSIIISLFD